MTDYSCYITIINKSSVPLTNGFSDHIFGKYGIRPPTTIAAKTGKVEFKLEKKHIGGSTGFVKYDTGKGRIQFDYSCPLMFFKTNKLFFTNIDSGLTISFYGTTKAGFLSSIPAGEEGQFPANANPLSCIFIVTD